MPSVMSLEGESMKVKGRFEFSGENQAGKYVLFQFLENFLRAPAERATGEDDRSPSFGAVYLSFIFGLYAWPAVIGSFSYLLLFFFSSQ